MRHYGMIQPGATLYCYFDTFDGGTGASITMTGLAVGDILVYKDGGTTQRASTSGYTLLDTDGIDFDALTGIHGFSISLADNTTAGFWAAGSHYVIVVSTITVDAQTVSYIQGDFWIGHPAAVLNTTIATLASQTSFTLTTGPAEDDALNGCVVYIHDVASAVQGGYAVVSDYTGASKTVTLVAGTTFTAAATDNIAVFPRINVGGVWDEDATGHQTQGTFGQAVGDPVADANTIYGAVVTGATGATIAADIITIDDFLDTEIATLVTNTTEPVDANVTQWLGAAAATPTVAGVPEVDVTHWIGTAAATPTTGGVPEVDITFIAGAAVSTASAQLGVNVVQVSADATAADRLEAVMDGQVTAAVNGVATTTSIPADGFTEATNDHFNGRLITFTSGALLGQQTDITDYVGATQTFTVTALTEAPADNDTFVIT